MVCVCVCVVQNWKKGVIKQNLNANFNYAESYTVYSSTIVMHVCFTFNKNSFKSATHEAWQNNYGVIHDKQMYSFVILSIETVNS